MSGTSTYYIEASRCYACSLSAASRLLGHRNCWLCDDSEVLTGHDDIRVIVRANTPLIVVPVGDLAPSTVGLGVRDLIQDAQVHKLGTTWGLAAHVQWVTLTILGCHAVWLLLLLVSRGRSHWALDNSRSSRSVVLFFEQKRLVNEAWPTHRHPRYRSMVGMEGSLHVHKVGWGVKELGLSHLRMSQGCLFGRDCGEDTPLGLHQVLVSPRLRVILPLSRGPLDLTAFDH